MGEGDADVAGVSDDLLNPRNLGKNGSEDWP